MAVGSSGRAVDTRRGFVDSRGMDFKRVITGDHWLDITIAA